MVRYRPLCRRHCSRGRRRRLAKYRHHLPCLLLLLLLPLLPLLPSLPLLLTFGAIATAGRRTGGLGGLVVPRQPVEERAHPLPQLRERVGPVLVAAELLMQVGDLAAEGLVLLVALASAEPSAKARATARGWSSHVLPMPRSRSPTAESTASDRL